MKGHSVGTLVHCYVDSIKLSLALDFKTILPVWDEK